MLILKEGEVCPFSHNCPYNGKYSDQGPCWGTRRDRLSVFRCSYVDSKGNFTEGSIRSKYDVTGEMKVLLEKG